MEVQKVIDTIPYSLSLDIKENDISIWERNITSNWMIYYEIISINKNLNFYQKRWTLAHEMWHFFDETEVNEITPYLTRYKQEKSADEYAYNCLIPDNELKEKVEQWWNLENLQVYFWIPQDKIKVRIENLYKWNENLNFIF